MCLRGESGKQSLGYLVGLENEITNYNKSNNVPVLILIYSVNIVQNKDRVQILANSALLIVACDRPFRRSGLSTGVLLVILWSEAC